MRTCQHPREPEDDEGEPITECGEWSVDVDGELEGTGKHNGAVFGIMLTKGEHNVLVFYQDPVCGEKASAASESRSALEEFMRDFSITNHLFEDIQIVFIN